MIYDFLLSDLIKSLSKAEKRYFKINAGRHTIGEENNYVKLFDQIEQNGDDYNKKLFVNISAKTFSASKRYLYNLILKSLRGYHEKTSGFTQLNGLINDIYYLNARGLYSQCTGMINKAKKMAYLYERFEQLPSIIYWEKILLGTGPALPSKTKAQLLYNEELHIQKTLKEITELEYVRNKMWLITTNKGQVRSEADLDQMHFIIRNELPKKENKSWPLRAKVPYYVTLSLYYEETGNKNKSYYYRKKIVELLNANPILIREYFNTYVSLVHNLMVSQRWLKKHNELIQTTKELRGLKINSPKQQAEIFSSSYHAELSIYIESGQFEKALILATEIKKGLNEFNHFLRKEVLIIFYCNLTYLYFGVKEYKKSLRLLNAILEMEDKYLREDIQAYLRIFTLIIHYEMGDMDALSYYERTAARFLTRKNRLFKTEKSLLYFFRKKIYNAGTKTELTHAFIELKNEINDHFKDPLEMRSVANFDLLSWINSKIENRSFETIVKEKALRNAGNSNKKTSLII